MGDTWILFMQEGFVTFLQSKVLLDHLVLCDFDNKRTLNLRIKHCNDGTILSLYICSCIAEFLICVYLANKDSVLYSCDWQE